jgi:hypothetical protein
MQAGKVPRPNRVRNNLGFAKKKAQENFALGHCVQGEEDKGPGRRPIVGQGVALQA